MSIPSNVPSVVSPGNQFSPPARGGLTTWFGNKLNQLHFAKFTLLFIGLPSLGVGALILLGLALAPVICGWFVAGANYQPTVFNVQPQAYGWTGEDADHQSLVMVEISGQINANRLVVITIPAGNSARTASVQSEPLHATNPQIISVVVIRKAGKITSLTVKVRQAWNAPFAEFAPTDTYTLSNNAAALSNDPNSAGYHAPGFVFTSGGAK